VVPRETTIIILEDELPGAQAWAGRHGVPLRWLPESLEVRVTLTQPETNEPFYLRGRFDDYRQLAPAWVFTDAGWAAEPRPQLFPRPGQSPYGASVLHSASVICAPFNRLAYKEHRGPHDDWGGPANWLTAGRANEVTARHLGDMLQAIFRDLMYSRGRMA
jgi:hypothetical protein